MLPTFARRNKSIMKRLLVICIFCLGLGTVKELPAQCSMCRRVAESNLESGEKKGKSLNSGILYLMSLPYVMGGVAGYIWWKNRKPAQD